MIANLPNKFVWVLLMIGIIISICVNMLVIFGDKKEDMQILQDGVNANYLDTEDCNSRNCLVMTKEKGLIGFGELTGYHRVTEIKDVMGDSLMCNSFVIIGGNKKLINYLSEIQPGGLDVDDNGVKTLDLYYTSEVESSRERVIQSSEEMPVTIQIALLPPENDYKDGAWSVCGLRISVIDAFN